MEVIPIIILTPTFETTESMNKTKFKALSSEDQWKWIIENKSQVSCLFLDNDCTYVRSKLFKEDEDESEEGEVSLKGWIGNAPGIDDLLYALGINFEGA